MDGHRSKELFLLRGVHAVIVLTIHTPNLVKPDDEPLVRVVRKQTTLSRPLGDGDHHCLALGIGASALTHYKKGVAWTKRSPAREGIASL